MGRGRVAGWVAWIGRLESSGAESQARAAREVVLAAEGAEGIFDGSRDADVRSDCREVRAAEGSVGVNAIELNGDG